VGDTLLDRIEKMKCGKTTKSQRKLLDYLCTADYKQVIYMSITQLAEETGCAEATVLRFCRSIGFNGYQEFKLKLAQELANAALHRTVGAGDIGSVIEEYQDTLDLCRRSISQNKLNEVVDCIYNSRTVSVGGVGHSYLAALELHNRLLKMGFLTFCEEDMHFLNMLVATRSKEDVLILFSVSGGTKDMIEVAELARSNGLKIIVVTCYEKSPLTRYADLVLSSAPTESPIDAGSMSAKIMQLFMVDIICRGVRVKDEARFDESIAKSNVATSGKLI